MSAGTGSEAEILSSVIAPERADLSPELSETILKWRFNTNDQDRMTELAERNQQDQLTPDERDELDRYLRVGSLINILQAKARLSLKRSAD